jgi:acyl-CoA synthetase (AMP-forming)/AMP-acid ligase II
VVAVPDERKGALPVAFVVAEPGTDPTGDELRAWCLARGPAFAHPRRVWVIDSLPLGGTQKVDVRALTEEAVARWRSEPAG